MRIVLECALFKENARVPFKAAANLMWQVQAAMKAAGKGDSAAGKFTFEGRQIGGWKIDSRSVQLEDWQ